MREGKVGEEGKEKEEVRPSTKRKKEKKAAIKQSKANVIRLRNPKLRE